jgi:hypothetical protein
MNTLRLFSVPSCSSHAQDGHQHQHDQMILSAGGGAWAAAGPLTLQKAWVMLLKVGPDTCHALLAVAVTAVAARGPQVFARPSGHQLLQLLPLLKQVVLGSLVEPATAPCLLFNSGLAVSTAAAPDGLSSMLPWSLPYKGCLAIRLLLLPMDTCVSHQAPPRALHPQRCRR